MTAYTFRAPTDDTPTSHASPGSSVSSGAYKLPQSLASQSLSRTLDERSLTKRTLEGSSTRPHRVSHPTLIPTTRRRPNHATTGRRETMIFVSGRHRALRSRPSVRCHSGTLAQPWDHAPDEAPEMVDHSRCTDCLPRGCRGGAAQAGGQHRSR